MPSSSDKTAHKCSIQAADAIVCKLCSSFLFWPHPYPGWSSRLLLHRGHWLVRSRSDRLKTNQIGGLVRWICESSDFRNLSSSALRGYDALVDLIWGEKQNAICHLTSDKIWSEAVSVKPVSRVLGFGGKCNFQSYKVRTDSPTETWFC